MQETSLKEVQERDRQGGNDDSQGIVQEVKIWA